MEVPSLRSAPCFRKASRHDKLALKYHKEIAKAHKFKDWKRAEGLRAEAVHFVSEEDEKLIRNRFIAAVVISITAGALQQSDDS